MNRRQGHSASTWAPCPQCECWLTQSRGSPRQSQCSLKQSQFPLTPSQCSLRVSERSCEGILWAAQWEPSPSRGLHKLCCSCRTSPSSPCPLCSRHRSVQIKTVLGQGSKDLPNKHLPFYLFVWPIFVGSLPYQLLSEVLKRHCFLSLFFSAAVNYDKHDKVMTLRLGLGLMENQHFSSFL